MHIDRSNTRWSKPGLTATEKDDARVQAVVLSCLLSEYPEQFSQVELARELIGDDPEFPEGDAFERSVEDLIRLGLLQRQDCLILPTRAALHFHGLELE